MINWLLRLARRLSPRLVCRKVGAGLYAWWSGIRSGFFEDRAVTPADGRLDVAVRLLRARPDPDELEAALERDPVLRESADAFEEIQSRLRTSALTRIRALRDDLAEQGITASSGVLVAARDGLRDQVGVVEGVEGDWGALDLRAGEYPELLIWTAESRVRGHIATRTDDGEARRPLS